MVRCAMHESAQRRESLTRITWRSSIVDVTEPNHTGTHAVVLAPNLASGRYAERRRYALRVEHLLHVIVTRAGLETAGGIEHAR